MSKAGDQARSILKKASSKGNKTAKKALAKDKARRSKKSSSKSKKKTTYSKAQESKTGLDSAKKLLAETKARVEREKLKRTNINLRNSFNTKNSINKYLKNNNNISNTTKKQLQTQIENIDKYTNQVVKAEQTKIKQKQLQNRFNSALDKARKGEYVGSTVKQLMNEGMSGDGATAIVNAYNLSEKELNKIKNTDYNKYWKFQSEKTGGIRTVDPIEFERAYKTSINQELKRSGYNEIKVTEPSNKFNSALKKLQNDRKNTRRKIKKIDTKKLQSNEMRLLSIETSGQSATPKQMIEINKAKRNIINRAKKETINKTILDIKNLGYKFMNKKDRNELANYIYNEKIVPFVKGGVSVIGKPLTESIKLGDELIRGYKIYSRTNNKDKNIILANAFKQQFTKNKQKQILKETLTGTLNKNEINFLSTVAFLYGSGKLLSVTYKSMSKIFGEKITQRVLTVGLTGMVSNDVIKAIKNPSLENRANILETVAFTGVLGKMVTKVRKLSPLTIKNVKILDGSASERVTSQALRQLEGKKIDLFHATKGDIKQMFKGTQISKKELDFLVKEMKRKPELFIDGALKIKPLKTIAVDKPKKGMLEFAMNKSNLILSGSASLKLQLKKFRKIGDLDFISSNAKQSADSMVKYLNKKTFLGKFIKNRYKVHHNKGTTTWQIWDSLLRKKYNKKFDIADIKQSDVPLSQYKTIKIKGIKVYDVKQQLIVKSKLSQDLKFLGRQDKELKDILLIAQKKIKAGKLGVFQKLMKKNNIMRVRIGDSGVERQWYWTKNYYPNERIPFGANPKVAKKWANNMRRRLKKDFKFSDQQINKNLKLHGEVDMYFAPNQIYSYYLRSGKGKNAIIMIKDQKISNYSKKIQNLIKRNQAGSLSIKEKTSMRLEMNKYRKANPDKVFLSPKTLNDNVGELEVLAPIFTRLFKKPQLLRREIYIPSLNKFVKVQEATIGKVSKTKLQKLYARYKSKFKRGYLVPTMKKDITNWAKRNGIKIKTKIERIVTKKGRKIAKIIKKRKNTISRNNKLKEQTQIKKEREFLKQERDKLKQYEKDIKNNKDLTKKQKKKLLESTKRQRNKLKVKRVSPRLRTRIIKGRNNLKTRISKLRERIPQQRTIPRPKASTKPRTIPRPKTSPKPRTTSNPKTSPKPRTIPRPKTTTKPRTIPRPRLTPPPTEEKKKPRVLLRLKFQDNKIPINKVLEFKGTYRERRNENLRFNKRTNPRVIKTFKKKTTKNRMAQFVAKKVLNNLARSFEIEVIRITNKKMNDIKFPKELKSFRKKKGKNARVLKYVQKKETLLKSIGERREIKRLRKKTTKTKKKTTTRRKKKVVKVKKKKKSSKIKRKKITSKKRKKK